MTCIDFDPDDTGAPARATATTPTPHPDDRLVDALRARLARGPATRPELQAGMGATRTRARTALRRVGEGIAGVPDERFGASVWVLR